MDPADFADQLGACIVHFGDTLRTARAIASLRCMPHRPKVLFIVDNSANWHDRAEGYEVLSPERNLGYAGAVNLAVAAISEHGLRYAWILNNDVVVATDAVSHFAAAFAQFPAADVVGSFVASGRHCYYGGGRFDARSGRSVHVSSGIRVDDVETGGPIRTDWVNGASMIIPVESCRHRGPFDENLFLYKEELEWQTREPRANAVVVRQFLVDHEVGSTAGGDTGTLGIAFMTRNALILARRESGVTKLLWLTEAARTYLLYPLAKGRFSALRAALIGVLSINLPPDALLERLGRSSGSSS